MSWFDSFAVGFARGYLNLPQKALEVSYETLQRAGFRQGSGGVAVEWRVNSGMNVLLYSSDSANG